MRTWKKAAVTIVSVATLGGGIGTAALAATNGPDGAHVARARIGRAEDHGRRVQANDRRGREVDARNDRGREVEAGDDRGNAVENGEDHGPDVQNGDNRGAQVESEHRSTNAGPGTAEDRSDRSGSDQGREESAHDRGDD